ncbi:hypothetical protein IQ260_00535 [Leptolyngbya cf. ectocarpi LEGE 11479]|uniref:Uncharacterized protein n=1 Tax=Leptolyngbya cf. ectocarpi LEGE 11479 TaxID=1828722 RepID=A0A928WXA7_LEPEC|nr:hypothetical protein [Leptolyngbya ectocarpi]MBE9065139.1 hypothetical protein [Leptolyngbya cf. ectocarpi LEGE 11479]
MDSNFLDIDLLSPAVRNRLAHASGSLLGKAWEVIPKRALLLYGSAIAGAFLVFAPVERGYYSDEGLSYRWPPALGLLAASTGLTLIAAAQAGLTFYQNELNEAEDDHQFVHQLKRQAYQDTEVSRLYTAVSEIKLENNANLPAHMKEPGLVDPAIAQRKELEEFKALMGATDGDGDTTTTKTRGFRKGNINGFEFTTRKNSTTKATEQCVSLKGKRKWCGVPIENPIPRFLADDRSLLGYGTTGVGKSAFLEAIISAAYQKDESTDFVTVTHKSGNAARGETVTMAGLEKTQDFYTVTNTMQGQKLIDATVRLMSRVNTLEALLEAGSLVPSFVLIDEGNEGTKALGKAARRYVEMNTTQDDRGKPVKPDKPTWQEDYSDFIETLIVDGRSKGVRGVVFGHMTTNKSGITAEIRNQNYTIALGRNGIYGSIEKLLSDNRYITLKDTREALKEEYGKYLKQHNANGSPVNVVLALTNIGGQWRLIVLPQSWDVQSITPSVVNPAIDEDYGFEDTTKVEEVPKIQPGLPVDATRQNDPLACYSPEQKQLAIDFFSWFKENSEILSDGTGLLDLRVPLRCWSAVTNMSQLEMALEVLETRGYGEFYEDPITHALYWKMYSRTQRQKEVEKVKPQPESDISKLDIPDGISTDAFRYCAKKLFELQVGSTYTVSSFYRGASSLRKNHDLSVQDVYRLLSSKSLKKVIQIDSGEYHSKLQFKVLWTPPG